MKINNVNHGRNQKRRLTIQLQTKQITLRARPLQLPLPWSQGFHLWPSDLRSRFYGTHRHHQNHKRRRSDTRHHPRTEARASTSRTSGHSHRRNTPTPHPGSRAAEPRSWARAEPLSCSTLEPHSKGTSRCLRASPAVLSSTPSSSTSEIP